VVVLGLAATALEGIGIGLMIPLLDMALADAEPSAGRLPGLMDRVAADLPEERRAVLLGLAILALIVLKNAVVFANEMLQAWIYGRTGHRLRQALSDRLLAMDGRLSMTLPHYRLLNVISNESWRAADAVGTLLAMLVSAAAVTIFACFLLALSPLLTLIVAVSFGGIALVHDLASRHFTRLGREVAVRNQGLARRMLHHVGAWRLIRLFDRGAFEAARFDAASDEVRRAGLSLQARQAALGPLTEIAHAAVFLLVVLVAWRSGMSLGATAAFLILLYRMQPKLRAIQAALASLRGWTGSLDEVGWLLGLEQDARRRAAGRLPAPALAEGIAFEGVNYDYRDGSDGDARALRDCSFRIPAGRSTALIGRSGSGKSTAANLVCGLLRPGAGRILVDGIPLDRIDPADWLARIALASQELDLFDGTVAENIRYGAPDASDAEVERAAREADADGFVRALPEAYGTPLGERGASLSGGQRQRIALARALVRRPRLLILDEATNAMDLLSEAVVLELLRRRKGRGTTLVITHHLTSIRLCDSFVCLRGGRVVATGETADLDEPALAAILEG
jgi:ABC-type multidrug transport system fused ATPase/permease subunit